MKGYEKDLKFMLTLLKQLLILGIVVLLYKLLYKSISAFLFFLNYVKVEVVKRGSDGKYGINPETLQRK